MSAFLALVRTSWLKWHLRSAERREQQSGAMLVLLLDILLMALSIVNLYAEKLPSFIDSLISDLREQFMHIKFLITLSFALEIASHGYSDSVYEYSRKHPYSSNCTPC